MEQDSFGIPHVCLSYNFPSHVHNLHGHAAQPMATKERQGIAKGNAGHSIRTNSNATLYSEREWHCISLAQRATECIEVLSLLLIDCLQAMHAAQISLHTIWHPKPEAERITIILSYNSTCLEVCVAV